MAKTKPNHAELLHFIKAMEINGISPLVHYYEEIYTNQVGLPKLGLRGDRNYLFYSIDGLGAGHYEKTEMLLSAESAYHFFQSKQNKVRFFNQISKMIEHMTEWREKVEKIDLTRLTNKQVAQYFLEANQIHGECFSLYVVSQPYRMKKIETELRWELSKRVAASRIDHYMTLLATSVQPTKVSNEELDWLKLLIKHKSNASRIGVKNLEVTHPLLYSDVRKHFNKYKILTLGDGNWVYNIDYYLNNLKNDYGKSLVELKERYKKIKNHPAEVKKTRERLIKELYLTPEVVDGLDFLAEVGHTRFNLRVDGWVPFVSIIIKLDIELAKRLGHKDILINFMTEEELIDLAKNWRMVNEKELAKRRGKNSEFLTWHDHGKYRILYGAEASKKFRELVPVVDHEKTLELCGSTAMRGRIKGRVCLYKWNDDIAAKMKSIKKHKILVAGQTRPSMMPIIRMAEGIVTDEGGITSHAAIVSRELGIPSVIGTVHATQVFKEGDLVELDADSGVVRKIS